MKRINLKKLEDQVKENNRRYKDVIEDFTKKSLQSDLIKERVRVRHKTEQKILDHFKQK